MGKLTIDGRTVGLGHPTLVVAEIGVNHDGSAQKAMELVRMARACGADAVKLQVFRSLTLVHASCELAAYQRGAGSETPLEMLRRYELSGDDAARVVKAIRDAQMIPLATPFSPGDLDLIERLRLPAVKIASPDLVNRPLIAAAARLGRPMIVSTGAASMDEVDATAGWLREWNAPFALLHCVSSYPVPSPQANLCWIGDLARRFADVPVGYSDHTTSLFSGGMAAAAGAVIVERHLTYDRAAKGPDHATSSDPAQFERYVKMIREADVLRGAPGKRVLEIEQDVRQVSRQSLVLRHSLAAGAQLREEDLTVQRPGTGLPAAEIAQAVGRRLARAVTAGVMLQWDMLDAA